MVTVTLNFHKIFIVTLRLSVDRRVGGPPPIEFGLKSGEERGLQDLPFRRIRFISDSEHFLIFFFNIFLLTSALN